MCLNELPLGLPGNVYGSPMPFGDFDPHDEVFAQFRQKKVATVVLLNEEEEYKRRSGRDLKAFYLGEGLEVIHLPIPDFYIPRMEELVPAVDEAIERARAGKNVVVHCFAGMGRTGLFVACMARKALGMSAEESIGWTRRHIAGAIQTIEQERIIADFR